MEGALTSPLDKACRDSLIVLGNMSTYCTLYGMGERYLRNMTTNSTRKLPTKNLR